jgi:hypothetical protein
VYAALPGLGGTKVLIVTSHLDADSALRAGLQGVELAKRVKDIVDSSDDISSAIWGGDFNMEMRSPAMKSIRKLGFSAASSALGCPTVFAVAGTVRVDHIMIYIKGIGCTNSANTSPCFRPVATLVPRCPLGHMISVIPFLSELQRLACALSGEQGRFMQAFVVLVITLFFPLILALVSPLVFHFWDRRKQCERLGWALAEWGSDHLPVTVCMQYESNTCACAQRGIKRLAASCMRRVGVFRQRRRSASRAFRDILTFRAHCRKRRRSSIKDLVTPCKKQCLPSRAYKRLSRFGKKGASFRLRGMSS